MNCCWAICLNFCLVPDAVLAICQNPSPTKDSLMAILLNPGLTLDDLSAIPLNSSPVLDGLLTIHPNPWTFFVLCCPGLSCRFLIFDPCVPLCALHPVSSLPPPLTQVVCSGLGISAAILRKGCTETICVLFLFLVSSVLYGIMLLSPSLSSHHLCKFCCPVSPLYLY